MSANQQSVPGRKSLAESIWEFCGLLFAAGMIGVWIGVGTRGAEILNLPSWAWKFAEIGVVIAAALLRIAIRMGEGKDAWFAAKACGVLFLAGLGVFFLTGFFGEPHPGEPGTLGVSLAVMIPALGRAIAWGVLVGVPAIAMLASGGIVVSALRAKHHARTS